MTERVNIELIVVLSKVNNISTFSSTFEYLGSFCAFDLVNYKKMSKLQDTVRYSFP